MEKTLPTHIYIIGIALSIMIIIFMYLEWMPNFIIISFLMGSYFILNVLGLIFKLVTKDNA